MPMPRGFPRPVKFIKKVSPNKANNRKSDYSDWDNKHYPVPYSAKMHDIGDIAKGRVRECVKHRLCMVCGIKVEDEVPWGYVLNGWTQNDSGPFHEKCAKLTQAKCPVVSVNRGFRFAKIPWDKLKAGRYLKEFDV